MKSIIINPKDNVAVALEDLPNGIPRGHKFALCNIAAGENIIKYGMPIGHAICDIAQGEWVHTHNLKTNLNGIIEYHYEKSSPAAGATTNATTDKEHGLLKKLANDEGYETFIIPNNIGGRYSALTPVGMYLFILLGFDYKQIIKGASDASIPNISLICFLHLSTSADGKSIVLITGKKDKLLSKAKYKLDIVCA